MKKNLWIWALAAFSMAACTSEDVPTKEEQVVTENDFESPDGRVVVQLGAESTPAAIISRAPIEGSDITALQELGIFAINRNETISQNEYTNWPNIINNCLLKNVKAAGTTNDPLDNGVNKGKRLTLYNTAATNAGYVYYYPIQGQQNYDFYGYQPRVDQTNLNNGKIEVTFDLSKGDVDLITGEAPTAKTINEDTLYVTEATNNVAATTGNGIINGYNAKYVRKIKYNNWIIDESQNLNQNKLDLKDKEPFIPNISFNHRLTKLNFQIITAKEQSGEESNPNDAANNQENDREEATKLRVSNIKLDNVHVTATLTIGQNMPLRYTSSDESVNMNKITTGASASIWENETDIKPQNYTSPEYAPAGYVMVPATNQIPNYDANPYQILLKVKSTDSMGIPQTQDVTLDLKDYTFEAGKSYNIRIALYALQKVHVSAELTPWDENTTPVYVPVE